MVTIPLRLVATVILAAVLMVSANPVHAQPVAGQQAPLFSLRDLTGRTFDLAAMRESPLTIIYFFDVVSKPSQEGLLSLNELAKQHPSDLRVWAVTDSPKSDVARFASASGLTFPVLVDGAKAGALYLARQVLPVVCIIGPKLKVLDYFQGGGKTTELMLVRVAERELQRRKTEVAKAIGRAVASKDPQDVQARLVTGHASLREGHLQEAEAEFKGIEKRGGRGDVPAKVGLAAVYTRRHEYDKALALIHEVQQQSPDTAYANVLEAQILAARKKNKEAEDALRKAVGKKSAEPYLAAIPYNMLGESYARGGQRQKARELFAKAESVDPYYVEGTTNKGISYEKEGHWDKALAAYREALSVDKTDLYAQVLAKRAEQMIELRNKDTERGKRIDRLVTELAERFRSRQKEKPPEDTWTSRPMVLTFLDFEEKGGLPEREGFSTVFLADLAKRLNESGRVTVVDRVLMDRLLEELNLGSSQLADPDTALRLGKVLAAKLIGTGSVLYLPEENLLSFRLIDVETSEIPAVVTREIGPGASFDAALADLNREILKTVVARYPVRGYVVKVEGDQAMLNVGAKQGVVTGTRFDVLGEPETVIYKGKTLHLANQAVGKLEVLRVEPEVSYARVLVSQRQIRRDDKVQGAKGAQ